jgi:hypothetical protein
MLLKVSGRDENIIATFVETLDDARGASLVSQNVQLESVAFEHLAAEMALDFNGIDEFWLVVLEKDMFVIS